MKRRRGVLRVFQLLRDEDVSGVSGVGRVAVGVVFRLVKWWLNGSVRTLPLGSMTGWSTTKGSMVTAVRRGSSLRARRYVCNGQGTDERHDGGVDRPSQRRRNQAGRKQDPHQRIGEKPKQFVERAPIASRRGAALDEILGCSEFDPRRDHQASASFGFVGSKTPSSLFQTAADRASTTCAQRESFQAYQVPFMPLNRFPDVTAPRGRRGSATSPSNTDEVRTG